MGVPDSDIPPRHAFATVVKLLSQMVRKKQIHILPAPDGIWHYRAGGWWFRATPELRGRWVHMAADSKNPDHWWLTTEQPSQSLETFDAGATWAEINETGSPTS